MAFPTFDPETFEKQAVEVAAILRALANERRLMILCRLVECGEDNVSSLAEVVGLSQSALSQHLARRSGIALPIHASSNSSSHSTGCFARRSE